jgi:beta-barrel assembly-enhancing protease
MSSFFYNLGRRAAPHILKARWIGATLAGTEGERIEAESRMGASLAKAFMRDILLEPDGAPARRLQDIGTRLAVRLRDRQRTFRIACMQFPEVNALALPGGFIFVSRSLVDLCGDSDDELAFTVAHEMGHVVQGHAARRFLTDAILRALAGRTRLAVPRGGGQALIALLTQLLEKNYSQGQETEADRFAVHLTASAGFDPAAASAFLRRLATLSDAPSALGQYLSSHPSFAARVRCVDEARASVAKTVKKARDAPPRKALRR